MLRGRATTRDHLYYLRRQTPRIGPDPSHKEDTRKARQKQPKKDISTRKSFQSCIPLFHSEELFFGQPEGLFL